MSFITNVIDAFQPKPTTQPKQLPKLGPADQQFADRMAAIEASKLKQGDDIRRAQLSHHLASEDSRKLAEQRSCFVQARKEDGKPLSHIELRLIDCLIELDLSKRAFDRAPGKPLILGDGTIALNKQATRVRLAERALKAAQDSLNRVRLMTSPGAVASTYLPYSDLSGYLSPSKNVADKWTAINKK
jgi:hypothetical protein